MFRSSHTQAAPLSPPFHGAACFCIANPFPNRLPSIGATATTAAGGGNRESLLGQRPARRKCFLKHKADAGGRNPALSAKQTERLQKAHRTAVRWAFCNLSVCFADKAGLRPPASALCFKKHLRLAGRCPNSDSLFPPPAAVVAVAPIEGSLFGNGFAIQKQAAPWKGGESGAACV